MSYFLITHPRSGSSNLGTNFCRTISEKDRIWNLDEMFYPGCRSSWGDFRKYSAEQQGVLLEIDSFIDTDKIKNVELVNIVSKHLYKKINHQNLDLNQWYEKEIANRLNFLKILDDCRQKYLVKLFVDDQRWFSFNFSNTQCLILYRKNLLEAVLSILIKNFYQNIFVNKNVHSDSYKGNFLIVPNFSFRVDRDYFYHIFLPFINLLKFIKKNKQIKKISYEELFDNNKNKEIDIFSYSITVKDIEKKLKYSKGKSEYIENYLELLEWISMYIKKEELTDICKELDINYE